ncbi:hypothetical protein BN132_2477 [Cronobacter turicensis 564]|nr:hypothetical protein BN132_2477 [Cronobacter turicensis 564]
MRRAGGRGFHIPLARARVAPPHKEQAEERKQRGGEDITQLRITVDEIHHRHKPDGTEQQPERRAALTPRGKRGALVRVFRNSRHHRAIRAVHHAKEQPVEHEQHRRHHGFTGYLKRRADEIRDSEQGYRKRGVQHKGPELALWPDPAARIEHNAGAHIGKRRKELGNQEDNAAISAWQPQHIGIELQQIQRADIQQDIGAQIAHSVGEFFFKRQTQRGYVVILNGICLRHCFSPSHTQATRYV